MTHHPFFRRIQSEKTGPTDDERIQSLAVLPPPEHLIRFFPINDTPIEALIWKAAAFHILKASECRHQSSDRL